MATPAGAGLQASARLAGRHQHCVVNSLGAPNHALDAELCRPARPGSRNLPSRRRVPNEPVCSGGERRDVTRRHQEPGSVILDQLGQASDAKRNGRDTERHGIDHCSAKSLRARRMQQYF